jgi:uncharacterized membrane protein
MDDIGALFGASGVSEADAINTHGDIAGVETQQGVEMGFTWSSGVLMMLESTQGRVPNPGSAVTGINDAGTVCGWLESPRNFAVPVGATWPGTGYPDLQRSNSRAYDINSSGVLVWVHINPAQMYRGALDVIPLPATTNYIVGEPLGIDDRNEVVGYVGFTGSGSSVQRAFFWDGASATSKDLGVLPTGTNSVAKDIDANGFIGGTADEQFSKVGATCTHWRGFIYHPNFGMVALPAPPTTPVSGSCYVFALNGLDAAMVVTVVGQCEVPGGFHAVRWDVTIRSVQVYFP